MNLDDCGTVDTLLSLYADGMASAEEARRVEAHLIDCDSCRASLSWIQATQHALSARPVVTPPLDLRARIAAAIAASSEAPAPAFVAPRPARAFVLRPAYAAAASITVLGVVGYSLLHHQPQATVAPVASPAVVAAKSSSGPVPAVKRIAVSDPKPHTMHQALTPAPKPVRVHSALVAHVQPNEAAAHAALARTAKTAAAASSVTPLQPRLPAIKKPLARQVPTEMVAANKRPSASAEAHKPSASQPEPNKPEAVIAANSPETPKPVSVSIGAPVIKTDQLPTVTVASTHESHAQTVDFMDSVNASVRQLRSAPYKIRLQSIKGAALATRTIEPGGTAYIDGIHTPR